MLTHRSLVLGDVEFGERSPRVRRMLDQRGYEAGLTHLQPFLEAADEVIVNLETPLIHAEDPVARPHPDRRHARWSDPDVVPDLLARAGVTAAGLANDHVMDQGPEALLRTQVALEQRGIRTFGAGADAEAASSPLRLDLPRTVGGGEIVVHAAFEHRDDHQRTYGSYASPTGPGCHPLPDEEVGDLRRCSPDGFHVAFPHWGPSYRWRTTHQRAQGKGLLDAGADVVLGHGARYAQEIERRFRRWVVYGLGNGLVNSPSRFERHAQDGILPFSFWAMLEVSWSLRGREVLLRLYPVRSDSRGTDYTPRVTEPREADDLIEAIRLRSSAPERFDNPHRYVEHDDLGPHVVLRLGRWKPGRAPSRLPSIREDEAIRRRGPLDLGTYDHLDRPTSVGHLAARYITGQDDAGGGVTPVDLGERLEAMNRAVGEAFDDELRRTGEATDGPPEAPELARYVDPQYVTHPALRTVERRKITLTRALSYRHMTVMDSEARRLGVRSPAWRLDPKGAAYRFADAIGLRRPAGAEGPLPLDEVDPDPRTVVKPERSTGGRCAYFVLDDEVRHVRDGETFGSWDEAREHARGIMERQGRIPDRWLVEELVVGADGEPARDLKFYTFYGRVVAVQEIVRFPVYGRCFWTGEGQPTELGHNESNLEGMEGEGFEEAWLREAQRVSLLIPTPCIRIDMLRSHDGVVLGEFTPRPGRFHSLTDHYDRLFGEELVAAQGRLLNDLLAGKRFEEFQRLFAKRSTNGQGTPTQNGDLLARLQRQERPPARFPAVSVR